MQDGKGCGGAKNLIAGGEDEGAWCAREASCPPSPYIYFPINKGVDATAPEVGRDAPHTAVI